MEMSGKYDFSVTYKVIETMEAESKVIVHWSYDYQIAKGSSDLGCIFLFSGFLFWTKNRSSQDS